MIKEYFQRRRLRKLLRQRLKDARHIRYLREDVADSAALKRLVAAETQGRQALGAASPIPLENARLALEQQIMRLCPSRRFAVLREYLEILVVAGAVAMGFRTYFLQPFKIPTASMFPTLYGIHYEAQTRPAWSDQFPLKLVKWALFGEWYLEVRSRVAGTVTVERTPEGRVLTVNGLPHRVPDGLYDRVKPGDRVVTGQLLASGIQVAGDHIFVDKVRWNFRFPRRGEIMIFKTDDIRHPQIKTNEYYVKRMVGLPDETLGIAHPYLMINGQRVTEPPGIARVENQAAGYRGYQLMGTYLLNATNQVKLAHDQYFACGDNQLNSLDSRYWGPVKSKNLVGPACWVYWPLSRRWGWVQ